MSKPHTIDEIKHITTDIARKYGVKSVRLFGSYARNEATEKSDIDLLIEKGKISGLFGLSGFKLDLEDKLQAKVDVMTKISLSPAFLKAIEKEEVLLYDEQY